jgi:opacity protein-like surface antigen
MAGKGARAARRLGGPTLSGLLVALGLSGFSSEAQAFERQWHLGIDFGYALSGFPEAAANGYGGGLHLAYGITDAFNLRLHGDVTVFDLPDPATSALIYNASLGVEYVFDVLTWVPYVGLLVGPVHLAVQDAEDSAGVVTENADSWLLGVEVPLGLGYQLSRSFTIGVEGRYRLFPFGDETSPTHNLLGLGRLEFTWGM